MNNNIPDLNIIQYEKYITKSIFSDIEGLEFGSVISKVLDNIIDNINIIFEIRFNDYFNKTDALGRLEWKWYDNEEVATIVIEKSKLLSEQINEKTNENNDEQIKNFLGNLNLIYESLKKSGVGSKHLENLEQAKNSIELKKYFKDSNKKYASIGIEINEKTLKVKKSEIPDTKSEISDNIVNKTQKTGVKDALKYYPLVTSKEIKKELNQKRLDQENQLKKEIDSVITSKNEIEKESVKTNNENLLKDIEYLADHLLNEQKLLTNQEQERNNSDISSEEFRQLFYQENELSKDNKVKENGNVNNTHGIEKEIDQLIKSKKEIEKESVKINNENLLKDIEYLADPSLNEQKLLTNQEQERNNSDISSEEFEKLFSQENEVSKDNKEKKEKSQSVVCDQNSSYFINKTAEFTENVQKHLNKLQRCKVSNRFNDIILSNQSRVEQSDNRIAIANSTNRNRVESLEDKNRAMDLEIIAGTSQSFKITKMDDQTFKITKMDDQTFEIILKGYNDQFIINIIDQFKKLNRESQIDLANMFVDRVKSIKNEQNINVLQSSNILLIENDLIENSIKPEILFKLLKEANVNTNVDQQLDSISIEKVLTSEERLVSLRKKIKKLLKEAAANNDLRKSLGYYWSILDYLWIPPASWALSSSDNQRLDEYIKKLVNNEEELEKNEFLITMAAAIKLINKGFGQAELKSPNLLNEIINEIKKELGESDEV